MRYLLGVFFLSLLGCTSSPNPGNANNSKGFVQGPPRPPPGAAESLIIGAEGGEVDLDGAKVNLPAGAIDEAVEIVVMVDATYPEDQGGSSFSAVYEFLPDGTVFNTPVRVELPFTGDAADAVIYWSSESDPTVFEPIETSIENQRAVAYVNHFSRGVVRHRCLWPDSCACGSDSDCASFSGVCSGVYYCDLSSKSCTLNKSTIVTCSSSSTQCIVNECNPDTGKCELIAGNEGSACDVGKCTVSDQCEAGVCKAGKDVCTECKKNSDCVDTDKDICTGTYYCDLQYSFPYKCVLNPATIVSCPNVNDTACKKNACDSVSGDCSMVNSPDGTSCDDGDICSGNGKYGTSDYCDKGICLPGPNNCECKEDSDCPDTDNDLCTGVPYCDKTVNVCKHNPATVVSCPTTNDTACSTNTCNASTGTCSMIAQTDATCDDDNVCTTGTTCTSAGQCGNSQSNPCECLKDSDCSDPDNDVCTGVPYCNKEISGPYECVNNPATVVGCPSVNDTPCQENTCNAASGQCAMLAINNGGSCDADGNACTVTDTCSFGSCVAGADNCACSSDSDCSDDGDLCNGTPYCDKSAFPYECKTNPATVVTCSIGSDTTCQQNTCSPSTGQCGMLAINNGGSCDADGNPCTAQDICSAGSCVAGADTCECTQDSECQDDGNPCNGTPYCDKSAAPYQCKPNPATVVSCSTTNDTACFQSQCIPGLGSCEMVATNDGGTCEADGLACTTDACSSGLCVKGAETTCTTCAGEQDCANVDCGGAPSFCEVDVCACGVPCQDDGECRRDLDPQCDASVCIIEGFCMYQEESDGTSCDLDGLSCTADTCQSGACTAGSSSCN